MVRRRLTPITILSAICLTSLVLMLWAAWSDSATNDEIVHIPAGYDYVHSFTYALNPEHPPLVKAVAAMPILFLHPTFPATSIHMAASPNNEWTVGNQFLYESGNNADEIIRIARLAPIALTTLAIIYIYLLSRMLMGPWWSLTPAFLFAFDPTILANGHLVTTDIGAAFGIVAATYYFLRYLHTRSRSSFWFTGILLGIAQLLKFSAIILIPFFFVLFLVQQMDHSFPAGDELSEAPTFPTVRDLVSIFLVGYGLVYGLYAIFMIHYPASQQVADTIAALNQRIGSVSGLGAVTVWMAGHWLFRPLAEYLLGLLMVASRVEGGVIIYAFGKVSLGAGWWYFPLMFLLKEPIATLLIILAAAIVGLAYFVKRIIIARQYQDTGSSHWRAFIVFALLSFVIAYWSLSMASPLDHGIRYLIPTVPFIYILSVYISSVVVASSTGSSKQRRITSIALGGLLVWLFCEALWTAPYFLSYYNEIGGGTWNGYHWATDSNYDWGQDLLRFRAFMNEHPEITSIAVGYLGQSDVRYYLDGRAIDWSSAKGNPATEGIDWFAISIGTLELASQPTETGITRNASDTYAWLMALRPPTSGRGNIPMPDYRIGTTIFVYHLPSIVKYR